MNIPMGRRQEQRACHSRSGSVCREVRARADGIHALGRDELARTDQESTATNRRDGRLDEG